MLWLMRLMLMLLVMMVIDWFVCRSVICYCQSAVGMYGGFQKVLPILGVRR